MSVLIKDMKMPTSEEKCKFFQPAPFRAPFCVINGVCHGIDVCPLIELPPHGKLIDVDALIKKCKEMADKEDGNQLDALALVEWFLKQFAPTIIEAEEGKT